MKQKNVVGDEKMKELLDEMSPTEAGQVKGGNAAEEAGKVTIAISITF